MKPSNTEIPKLMGIPVYFAKYFHVSSLNPSRVYAVDYLLAEANQQPMSRWGHSMLRLVICAPGRPPGSCCRAT